MRVFLDPTSRAQLIGRYRGHGQIRSLGYGTVRDYCDSADHLPQISCLQGDMKDLQRPWLVKAVNACVPSGSRLLEVGGGEPIVAGVLAELGYHVTLIDPYDGSGHGPIDYSRFVREYPHVHIIRALLDQNTLGLMPASFDCVYSVSVLEHVHEPKLAAVYQGIRRFLRPGGFSMHAVDHVAEGNGSGFHAQQVQYILQYQAQLAGQDVAKVEHQLMALMQTLNNDLDTYYLSASGHNSWRGRRPYDEFPFRKCVSIESVVQFTTPS